MCSKILILALTQSFLKRYEMCLPATSSSVITVSNPLSPFKRKKKNGTLKNNNNSINLVDTYVSVLLNFSQSSSYLHMQTVR